MMKLPFPPPDFKLKKERGKRFVFDGIRKAWLVLTDEEWVRQNFVAYLIKMLGYPHELIALEKEISVNGLRRRYDAVVFDTGHQPWMLVECKAPRVPLGEAVLQQALRYHLSVPVRFIVITNGDATVAWEKREGGLVVLDAMPQWPA